MVKKILLIVGAVVLLVGACLGTFFVTNHVKNEEIEGYTQQVAALNEKLLRIGEIGECYTVVAELKPGEQITPENITTQAIPENFKTAEFVDLSNLKPVTADGIAYDTETPNGVVVNYAPEVYAKITISPGTPITKNMIMIPDHIGYDPQTHVGFLLDSVREVDIVANRWPVGLQVGDYIDCRFTLPSGSEYIVLSHKRVEGMKDQTIKVHMTEEEQITYNAALVDFYITQNDGSDLYFTKYIEPGIQHPAEPFYSVSAEVDAYLTLNPNIVDLAKVELQRTLRDAIEAGLNYSQAEYDSKDKNSEIKSGRDNLNGAVNSDYAEQWREDEQKREEEKENQANGDDDDGSIFVSDVDTTGGEVD